MNPIATKELMDVRYALGSVDSSKSRYNLLKRTFSENLEYRIFAEPVIMSGNRITWMTEYEGQIINYKQLSEIEQNDAQELLSTRIKKLFLAAKTYQDQSLIDILEKCIEIPNVRDICIIKTTSGDQIVLMQWGFLSDVPGGEKGIIQAFINVKRVPVLIDVQYTDETIATFETVHVEYEGRKELYKSDANGKFTIPKVKVDSIIVAYQIEKETQIGHSRYTCYERGNYIFKVPLKSDMLFQVKTSTNEIVANEPFTLILDGDEIPLTTDTNGQMTIPKVKVESEVFVKEKEDRKINQTSFICKKEKPLYNIIIEVPQPEITPPPPIEKPKLTPMRIKVVDKDDKIIPNADITVEYAGKKVETKSDENGYAIIEDIEPNTKVKITAIKKQDK